MQKEKNPIRKMSNGSQKKEIQVTHTHMKRCSNHSYIEKCKLKLH